MKLLLLYLIGVILSLVPRLFPPPVFIQRGKVWKFGHLKLNQQTEGRHRARDGLTQNGNYYCLVCPPCVSTLCLLDVPHVPKFPWPFPSIFVYCKQKSCVYWSQPYHY